MKILIVLTSHDQLGDTGEQTGFWLEEFAAPTTRSRMPAPRWYWLRPKAASRPSIEKRPA